MGILRGEKFSIITLYLEKRSNDQKIKARSTSTASLKTKANYFHVNRKGSYRLNKIITW